MAKTMDFDLSDRAFYPLTLPLTVGPGSISVAIARAQVDRRESTMTGLRRSRRSSDVP
jgi:small neutral amino acid transporter SnatA (MarC family)